VDIFQPELIRFSKIPDSLAWCGTLDAPVVLNPASLEGGEGGGDIQIFTYMGKIWRIPPGVRGWSTPHEAAKKTTWICTHVAKTRLSHAEPRIRLIRGSRRVSTVNIIVIDLAKILILFYLRINCTLEEIVLVKKK
jgi:hypothetical protein